ncbi:MAG TPA: hypothetical protein VEJ86_00290 [Candidatus Binataceae bacterium]|nr:hypothetical protein [Candidatus Binataceae bacterium]
MSSRNGKNRSRSVVVVVCGLAAALAFSAGQTSAKSKGIEVEIPYDAAVVKTPGISAPFYFNENGSALVVSDQAGGVYSVTFGGKVTPLASKSAAKHPGGVAVAPAGFGSMGGQIFVLNAQAPGGPCEVDKIEGGGLTKFADLPDAPGGKPNDCQDLEAGKGPFAGKLYAATSANSAIYAIDSSGKATVFCALDKPMQFDLTAIGFTSASDSKAPNSMLVGTRPRIPGVARVGRIALVSAAGKLADDPYMVGFVEPTGFVLSPSSWGSYGDTFFISDMGKRATASKADAVGELYRVYKDVAREFATGLYNPTCMRFVGSKMVIADPAAKGAAGSGVLEVITSML